MAELVRRAEALAWELRMHALRQREIVVKLKDGAALPRVRGYVEEVGATGSYAVIDTGESIGLTVPLWMILSVRTPHFHETGDPVPAPAPRPRPEEIPGQLSLGPEIPGGLTRRTSAAAVRAAGMMVPQDLMDTLGALDRACRRKKDVPTRAVAVEAGRSPRWVIRRLGRLAEMRLAFAEMNGSGYRWSPGE